MKTSVVVLVVVAVLSQGAIVNGAILDSLVINVSGFVSTVTQFGSGAVDPINSVITTVNNSTTEHQNMNTKMKDAFKNFIVEINDQVAESMTKLNTLGLTKASNVLKAFLWDLTMATEEVQEKIISPLNTFSTQINTTVWDSALETSKFFKSMNGKVAKVVPKTNSTEFQECMEDLRDDISFTEENYYSDINDCIEKADKNIVEVFPNISLIQNPTEEAVNLLCNCVADVALGTPLSQRLKAKVCTDKASAKLNSDLLNNSIEIVLNESTNKLDQAKEGFATCMEKFKTQRPKHDMYYSEELQKCIDIGNA